MTRKAAALLLGAVLAVPFLAACDDDDRRDRRSCAAGALPMPVTPVIPPRPAPAPVRVAPAPRPATPAKPYTSSQPGVVVVPFMPFLGGGSSC